MTPTGEAALLVWGCVVFVVVCGGLVGLGVYLGRSMLDDRVAELERIKAGLEAELAQEEEEARVAAVSRREQADDDRAVTDAARAPTPRAGYLRLRMLLPRRGGEPAPAAPAA